MAHNKYICPISKLIFKDPVSSADGHIYERTAIEEWFKLHNISPVTGLVISTQIHPIYFLKTEIKEYLEKNPHLKKDQYTKDFDPEEILTIIKTEKFNDLYDYCGFKLRHRFLSDYDSTINTDTESLSDVLTINTDTESLSDVLELSEEVMPIIDEEQSDEEAEDVVYFKELEEVIHYRYHNDDDDDDDDDDDGNGNIYHGYLIKILLLHCEDNKVIKHVLDNSIDLWKKSDSMMKMCNLPIHQICIYGDAEIIIYTLKISRSIPWFDCELLNIKDDSNYFAPIIYISKRFSKNLELLKLFAEYNVNLEIRDCCDCEPIHHYCNMGDEDTIKFLIDYGVGLKHIDKHDRQPIHMLLTNSDVSTNFIKSFVRKIVCNNSPTISNMTPLYLICNRPDIDVELLLMLSKKFKMSYDSTEK